jgi:AAA ATPase domain/Effector-associated domain 8
VPDELPADLFEEAVHLLMPLLRTPQERDGLLAPILAAKPVYDSIDWAGAARDFTVRLVHKLSHDELIAVLKRSQTSAGEEQAPSFKSLCERINENHQDLLQRAGPTQQPGTVPVTVPPLPRPFVDRAADLRRLQKALAKPVGPRSVLAVAVHGMPGVGKTTLVQALCRTDTRPAQYQDVAWITLGREPGDLRSLIRNPPEGVNGASSSNRTRRSAILTGQARTFYLPATALRS